jgi:hypothetical protein
MITEVYSSNSYLSISLFYIEETIIFALIERAQYRRNYDIYDAKTTKLRNIYGAPLSFLEWMLLGGKCNQLLFSL